MQAIEFRVQGDNSAIVAQELVNQMKSRFGVTATVRASAPSSARPAEGEKVDPIHVTLVVLEVAVVLFHVYETFIRQPAEQERQRLVHQWGELVHWAKSKLPTTVRAVIGDESLLLHQSAPEVLHQLTGQAIKNASVVAE
jgi:hypothetical protein